MLVLLLIGAAAFVTDVVNPATPTPQIWPRVVVLSFLILRAIQSLAIVPDFKIALATSRPSSLDKCPDCYSQDVLALHCTRLR
jgi:hypothetical protein